MALGGGDVTVCGLSSGATLALLAAESGLPILCWADQLEEAIPNATNQVLPGERCGLDDAKLTLAICRFGAFDLLS